ncbi:MAG: tRNA (adenosine(37)-N6)-threonylcarbamoyltransferase complex dimerization subunit type 1 TsaB [Pseudomonadota bacterium]
MQINQPAKNVILAIDTATCGTHLALYQPQSQTCDTIYMPEMRGQSSHLVPEIDVLLRHAGCEYPNIETIVAITGPGSFTGIRVGLACAMALQIGLKQTLIGLDAFTAYRAMNRTGPLAVILETFRDDYFMAIYEGDAIQPAHTGLVTPQDIPNGLTLCGSGMARLQGMSADQAAIDWKTVLPFLHAEGYLQPQNSVKRLTPYYLRDADTSNSRKTQWSIDS